MNWLRVPGEYFITKGSGRSEETLHAGSYHHALKDAGIERFNIMNYSSVLPADAKQVNKIYANYIEFGSVLETIMARADYVDIGGGPEGVISAAIAVGTLIRKKDQFKLGSFVAERSGAFTELEAVEKANTSLLELYHDGYDDEYYLDDIRVYSNSMENKSKFGTVLVAICFVNYKQ